VTKHDAAGSLQWIRQIGTTGEETFNGVWADQSGNVYAAGWTRGALAGPSLGGQADALVVKYSTTGELLWGQQLGTIDRDAANGIIGDDDGNLYLAGNTRGSWSAPNAGGADAVLIKLSPPAAAASASALASDDAFATLAADTDRAPSPSSTVTRSDSTTDGDSSAEKRSELLLIRDRVFESFSPEREYTLSRRATQSGANGAQDEELIDRFAIYSEFQSAFAKNL
jgi:hypothetical protein